VLIPPKTPGLPGAAAEYWQGEELSEEDLKERLRPLVDDDDVPQDTERQIPMGDERKWDL
jgi:hypothetical protein